MIITLHSLCIRHFIFVNLTPCASLIRIQLREQIERWKSTNAACSTHLCLLSSLIRIGSTSEALRTLKQIHEVSALTNSALIIHKPWCVDSTKRTQVKNLTYREMKELLATVDVDYSRFAMEDGSAIEDTITFSEVAALSKVALDALFEA